jgi:hypothetical protein
MNKLVPALILGVSMVSTSVLAAPIFYQADNVTGTGSIAYGTGLSINDAPIFSFIGTSGTVTENLASYTPGDYTVSFYLDGLWVDANEDGTIDFAQADYGPDPFSFTSGPVSLPALSLVGSAGQLSWAFDPYSGGSLSYDFGTTGAYTNFGVNALLASVDFGYSHAANGVMDAKIGWDTLRVELNAVPEPSTLLLFGLGVLGLAGLQRKKRFS